jgi:hypothetical protein
VLGGVVVACIDIHRATTPSKIWAYAGLAVTSDGHAVRRKKGEKANYDPWFKAKMLKVLAESFIKSNSPWRIYYDNNKHRLESMRLQCIACDGTGKLKKAPRADPGEDEAKLPKVGSKCANCDGTGTGPWGHNGKHRDYASKRYMVKMFLAALYDRWRTLLGLEVRKPYQEQYLGHVHHDAFPWQTFDAPPDAPEMPKRPKKAAAKPARKKK